VGAVRAVDLVPVPAITSSLRLIEVAGGPQERVNLGDFSPL